MASASVPAVSEGDTDAVSALSAQVDKLSATLRLLLSAKAQPISTASSTISTAPDLQTHLTAIWNAIALSSRINTLSGSSGSPLTISNATVSGISGLTADEIPDLSSKYLPLVGGALQGILNVPALNASSTVLGSVIATNATSTTFFSTNASTANSTSTTEYSVSLVAGNATSTNFFATAGHLTAGTIDTLTSTAAAITNLIATTITGTNAKFTNATTTNATSTNAFATNLMAASGTITSATTTSLFASTFGLGGNYFTSLVGAGLTNISNALSLDLTHPNVWTAVQQFNGNASTTQLSATSAYFGGAASSTFTSAGWLGIGTSTPGSLLSIGDTNGINFSTATTTFSSTGGINLTAGCYSMGGTCIKGGGPAYLVAASNASAVVKARADAIATGSSDNVVIQTALDALPATGGTVVLSDGTFVISAVINVASNTHLMGMGEGKTILQQKDHHPLASGMVANKTTPAGGITLNDFTVDGNKANNGAGTSMGISLLQSSTSTIQNIEVKNVNGPNGIVVSGNGAASTVGDILQNIYVHDNQGYGLVVTYADRKTIVSNVLAVNNSDFMGSYAGVFFDASEVTATNIRADANYNQGIRIHNVFSVNISNMTATRNGRQGIYVEEFTGSSGSNWMAQNNGTATVNTYDDIYFDPTNEGSTSYGTTTQSVINGLLVGGNSQYGTENERYGIYIGDYQTGSLRLYGVSYGDAPLTGNIRMPRVGSNNVIVQDSGTSSAALTLQGLSAFGIGTSTPYSRLSVWGSDTSANTAAFTIANSASTTEFQVFDNGSATLAGTLTQNSDQRLKTNISTLDASSSLAAIDSLNPVSFNWVNNMFGEGGQLGFIAQDVQKSFPQLVSTTSATALTLDGTLGLNYTGLIAPIIGAIQGIAHIAGDFQKDLIAWLGNASNGITDFFARNGHFSNELCVGSTCVTAQQFQAMVAATGQTATAPTSSGQGSGTPSDGAASSTSVSPATPPVIAINGDNPAIIHVGDTYADLGATVTGPAEDLNLGIHTFVGNTPIEQTVLDTSTTTTYHIYYVATDSSGVTATSTRTVIIQPAATTTP